MSAALHTPLIDRGSRNQPCCGRAFGNPRRIVAASALIVACSEPLPAPITPVIDEAVVGAHTNNVLGASVFVRGHYADSAVVRYHLDGEPAASGGRTPAAPLVDGRAVIPVLGLLPARHYILSVTAYGAARSTVTATLQLTTLELPADLPRYTAGGSDPTPGYVVFAAGAYGLVLDNTGRVVWYHRFANGAGLAFIAQPNGRYVARPVPDEPSQPAFWVEVDPLGYVTRARGCALGLPSRVHDLIVTPAGDYWIMCDETRTLDLTAVGGVASARVTGTAVQHISEEGALLFHWSPFDHLAITDLDPAQRTGANVNWTHGNAIDLDADGNLLISFRSLGEVTKINTSTGAVIWRLGGRANQFTFVDTPAPAFLGQHSARAYAAGAIGLLDNLGSPTESRAERYTLDETTLRARLSHSYGSAPGVITQIGGSVQHLTAGRTLVSFGTAGRVEEYDAAGHVVWSITGDAGYVFRAQRIQSLYTPR